MSLTTDVIDLLDELGDDAKWVAATLAKKKIKGVPGDDCNCPIFNYLSAQGFPVVEVDLDTVFIQQPDGGDGDVIELPEAISAFIAAFDEREFPELIAGVVS